LPLLSELNATDIDEKGKYQHHWNITAGFNPTSTKISTGSIDFDDGEVTGAISLENGPLDQEQVYDS